MERHLAPHEAAVLAGDVRLVLYVDVEGELDEEILEKALAHLQACYPLLAGRFTAEGNRWLVETDDTGSAPILLGRGNDLEEEINAASTWTQGPLLRITLVRTPTRTSLVMTLPRSFADAMSYLAVHHRFWTAYTALSAGESIPVDVVHPVLGPALDDLLTARFSPEQLNDFVQQRAQLDADHTPAALPPLASVNGGPGADLTLATVHVKADIDSTATLARLAHEASLSVNSLVSGVLVTSLRSFLAPSTGPALVLCTSAVDMRRRLQPPIPAEVLQSAATTTSMRLEVDASATPLDIGLAISRQLRADLESGAAAMELAAFAHMIDQHPPTLVITNVGTITEPALPDGLQITSTQLAPLGHLPMIFAVVSHYRRQLIINLCYSRAWFTDAQIQDLGSKVSTTLHDLTA
jgi:phenolphthiocerol/phthiocerol/phthiodiolone dimycocerosyl transferase